MALEESRRFYQFLQDSEEEEAWLIEKMRLVKSQDTGKDLRSVIGLIKRHEVRMIYDLSSNKCRLATCYSLVLEYCVVYDEQQLCLRNCYSTIDQL